MHPRLQIFVVWTPVDNVSLGRASCHPARTLGSYDRFTFEATSNRVAPAVTPAQGVGGRRITAPGRKRTFAWNGDTI